MRTRALPCWRSILYVPVNVPRFVEKAHLRDADAIILDLEDSVAPSEKANARDLVREAARSVAQNGADVIVRINAPLSHAVRDLEAAVWPGIRAVCLPKIESGAHIALLSECVAELEKERGMEVGSTGFKIIVETARGFMAMQDILRAIECDARVWAMTLGGEDFSRSARMSPLPDALYVPNMVAVIGAHSVGVMALGFIGGVARLDDLEAFRAMIRRAKQVGFVGASCIHPSQIPILNEEFGVSGAEADWARRVLEAAEREDGRGAFRLDDMMIDAPIIQRARDLLERKARFASQDRS